MSLFEVQARRSLSSIGACVLLLLAPAAQATPVGFVEDFDSIAAGVFSNGSAMGPNLRALNDSNTGGTHDRTAVGAPHAGSAFAGGGNQVAHPSGAALGTAPGSLPFAFKGAISNNRDYLTASQDWTYEILFKAGDDGNSQPTGIFVGVGNDALRFNEIPSQGIFMVVYGDTTSVDGRVDIVYENNTSGGRGHTELANFSHIGSGSASIHRSFIAFDAADNDLTFNLDIGNTGGFDATHTVDLDAARYDFLDPATESGLLFGGKTWSSTDGTPLRAEFDDMVVNLETTVIPEPDTFTLTALGLLGIGLMLPRR